MSFRVLAGLAALLVMHGLSSAAHGAVKGPKRVQLVQVQIPASTLAGSSMTISGRLRPASVGRGAKVRLERRVVGRWALLATAKPARSGRFAVSARAPHGPTVIVVRITIRRSGRVLARSKARRISVRPPADPVRPIPTVPAAPDEVATRAPTPPPPDPAPVPEPLSLDAAPVKVVRGSVEQVVLPAPLTEVDSVDPVVQSPVSGLSAVRRDAGVAIAATTDVMPQETTVTISGEGCTSDACGRAFTLRVLVNVAGLEAPAGELQAFTDPAPDRIQAAQPVPGSLGRLPDELLVTLGTPDEPGSRAQAVAAAAAVGAHVSGGIEEAGLFELRWSANQDLEARRTQLLLQPGVSAVTDTILTRPAESSIWPSDLDDDQADGTWHFEQIRAPEAWGATTPSGQGHGVTVGIVDDGAVWAHPDLDVKASETKNVGLHATHVAGLACAKANGVGLVGVAWGCPIVTAGQASYGSAVPFEKRVLMASALVLGHADVAVINLSLTPRHRNHDELGETPCESAAERAEMLELAADARPMWMNYLQTTRARKVVWTVAAGNACAPGIPSGFGATAGELAHVIGVSATNSDGKLASFTNFGDDVEIAAPGGVYIGSPSFGTAGVWSTWYTKCGGGKLCESYAADEGTSMAAPIVAGIAALVRGHHPDFTAARVGYCLTRRASIHTGFARSVSNDPTTAQPQVAYDGRALPIADAAAAVDCDTAPPTIEEFPIPVQSSQPHGITLGPDGAMWFTDVGANAIGRITATGTVTEFPLPTANSGPNGITSGPDGALWFTANYTGKIGRITTNGTVTEFPLSVASSKPYGITLGPDDALWFTEILGNKIGRITTSGTITEFPLPGPGRGPAGIVTGPDNNLWFNENHAGAVGLGRITTLGAITEFPLPGSSPSTQNIAVGSDDALWYTDASTIGRMTTAGVVTEFARPQNSRPAAIAPGADGALWFTEYYEPLIGQATTTGELRDFALPPHDPATSSAGTGAQIATGPGETLWYTARDRPVIGRVKLG